tara:strand:+ start:14632 stop:15423 length:792 start_codon:yes stop_codon:yes gene_type:complete
MAHAPSFMQKTLLSLSVASLSILSTQLLAEQAPLKKAYQEPSRGFFLEHGTVAPSGKASVELYTGSGELYSDDDRRTGGAIRLGLSNGELILNSGLNGYDENEALLKWSLPRQNADGTEQTPIQWSLLAGLGYLDIDADNNANDYKQTSLTLGIAATIKADAGLFTVSPKLVYADIDKGTQNDDDTFLELDLGAYVGIIETEAGLFSVGAEALITTADNTDNTIALGTRWLYNDRINLDIVPFVFGDNDLFSIPGLVRLNIAF